MHISSLGNPIHGSRRSRSLRSIAVGFTAAAIAALGCSEAPSGPEVQSTSTVVSVAVTPGNSALVSLGETLQLTAGAQGSDGSAIPNKSFTWSSSADGIATVSASGLVTAVANGTATVSATADGVTGTAQVTVDQTVARVTVTPQDAVLLERGATAQLAASAEDARGNVMNGVSFSWTSSDDGTASIDASGKVIAVADGNVTITATDGGIEGTASVIVDLMGKIFVNHDEWTLSDAGFSRAPDATRFALNVANWFTDGEPGNFLVFSNNFGLTGTTLAATMTAAGHTWTVDRTLGFSLSALLQFDAIFLTGDMASNDVLIDYVNAGGHVYLAGGTGQGGAAAEAARWNTFLNAFGLDFGPTYDPFRATLAITSTHPVFAGVSSLYQDRGNPVSQLDPGDLNTDVLEVVSSFGLYAVFVRHQP